MKAKLIRTELNEKGIRYLDTYYYECINCGEEYFRHQYNDRINPYCGKCALEQEKIKARARLKQKQEYIDRLKRERDMAIQQLRKLGYNLQGDDNEMS